MQRQYDPVLKEELYQETYPNGLTGYVVVKPGYQKKYANYATHYGSLDRRFRVGGREVEVPDGIAHFLEHKLFESEDVPVMQQFAALGASCNAFTGHSSTTYLFSTTDHYLECLDVLMSFVQHPHLTEENVAKERGIIEQELRMYMDDPRWRAFHNLLEALYQRHPVRVDIGGTIDSIQRITVDDLLLCYRTFYRPDNMTFFAVGDVDPGATLALVGQRAGQGERPAEPIERLGVDEPPEVAQREIVARMAVASPILELGFKETDTDGVDFLEREVRTSVALEVLLGRGSRLYTRLYEEGLIDERFGAYYFAEPGFGASIMGGDTPEPERLRDALLEGIEAAGREGLEPAAIERVRRKALGEFLGLFNSPEAIATAFNAYHFKGYDFFQYLKALDGVNADMVNRCLEGHLRPSQHAASIVLPVS